MRMALALVFACILSFAASSVAGGIDGGDWLSSGYVVTGYHSPAYVWSPTVYYYGYFDYSGPDPWYSYVARPYLDSWYWHSWYYPSGVGVYPVSYYRPAYYWYWYGWPWPYSIYY